MAYPTTRSSLALLLFVAAAAPAIAQNRGGGSGGTHSLSDRVDITYQQKYLETPADGRTDWMHFVVLWRGQPGWRTSRGVTPEERSQSERMYREASAAATLGGHNLMGGYGGHAAYWAEVDGEGNTLVVLGKTYAVPPKDSTLIILVDRVDYVGGEPFIVGSAVIDGHMSSEFIAKTWTSGDTTFTVRPAKNGLDVFLENLKKDPAIAAFIQ
jgi:hypothetical protein